MDTYVTKPEEREEILLLSKNTESNNERFNRMLNRCNCSQRIYMALLSLTEPSIEKTYDVTEKRKIIIRDLLSWLDIPEGDKQII